jgi:predicted NUDIX family NTP pyrophosphohydrolase
MPSVKTSAGLMLFRRRSGVLEVFLVHPGGPFWAGKDESAWSIAKGEIEPGEAPEAAALREFEEETGLKPKGSLIPLGSIRQAGGKRVHGFALEGDCEPAAIRSNTFELEWPPRSGKRQVFPEIDRTGWFTLGAARTKINPAQSEFLDRLERMKHDL